MARITWAGMKTEAISSLRERTDISTRVEIWIRDAYVELLHSYKFHEVEKMTTFTLGVGATDKALSAIAADVKNVLSIRDTTTKWKLRKAHFRWMDNRTIITGIPSHYARFGDTLLFDAAPSAVITYQIRYRKEITEPNYVGSNYSELPEEWDEIIRLRAIAKGYLALLEPEMASQFEERAARSIALIPMDDLTESEDENFGIGVRGGSVYGY